MGLNGDFQLFVKFDARYDSTGVFHFLSPGDARYLGLVQTDIVGYAHDQLLALLDILLELVELPLVLAVDARF